MDATVRTIDAELSRLPKVEVSTNRDVLGSLRTPTHV
jgi:hypothetical protein